MNDKILRMCKAMLDVKDNHAISPCVRFAYDINCSECPFAKLNNEDNLKCQQRTNKGNVKLAEEYLERNEQDKTCMCNNYQNAEIYGESIYKNDNGEWILEIKTSQWDYYNDEYIVESMFINYCPYWGRKLD